jgi:diadenosine tetraphosphate (Ap4A) HIT family hydrolase
MKTMVELPEDREEAAQQGMAPWTEVEREDFHVIVYRDIYPVAEGHLLFVPQYSTPEIINQCMGDALECGMQKVAKGEWEAFNLGMNWGRAAGQTVPWPHIHLIPRKTGDCEDPTGGVRKVRDGQGNYRSPTYTYPMVYPKTAS